MIAELLADFVNIQAELTQWAEGNLWPILIYLIMVNAYAFALFAIDKNRAIAGGYLAKKRIPENTLLGLALLGGSPALVLGQKLLRHKTVKQPFGLFLKMVIALQIIGILIVFMDFGQFDLE